MDNPIEVIINNEKELTPHDVLTTFWKFTSFDVQASGELTGERSSIFLALNAESPILVIECKRNNDKYVYMVRNSYRQSFDDELLQRFAHHFKKMFEIYEVDILQSDKKKKFKNELKNLKYILMQL